MTQKGSSLRCSRPLCSSQSTGGTSLTPHTNMQETKQGPRGSSQHPTGCRSGPSGPNSVHIILTQASRSSSKLRTKNNPRSNKLIKCSTHELPAGNMCSRSGFWTPKSQMLLRKEVIQPHLPVRLPCYDLVLITDPTFDGSLPKGLGHRLQVLPTFMT